MMQINEVALYEMCDEEKNKLLCRCWVNFALPSPVGSGRKIFRGWCGAKDLPHRGAKQGDKAEMMMRAEMEGKTAEKCLPSRTSRWYACRYLRTCRSSDLYVL